MLPKWSKYIPHSPTVKQQAFLWLDDLDAFYGGAAGGGKSDALLMAALQYVDQPNYNAVLLRDTYANLSKPEGLLDRAHEWLQNTDARWMAEKKYVFPSGATLSFSYLDGPLDHFNHQGPAYQFVGIDEVVNIRENQALYMFSRLRRLSGSDIPIRFRCASNPPTSEQLARGAWVKKRYIDHQNKDGRIFIGAKLYDNPHLDAEDYIKQLNQLDPITRAQLLEGDWYIQAKGRMFDRTWFPIVDQAPAQARRVRFYDPAHTDPAIKLKDTDPDYFAGCKASLTTTGLIFIEHMSKWRKTPLRSKEAVKQQAMLDGKNVDIVIEREPSAGTALIDDYVRLLMGWTVKGYTPPKGYKMDQAGHFASYAEAGNVYIVNGPWVEDFLNELEIFPDGAHDDQVRAAIGAFDQLVGKNEINMRWV